MLVLMWFLFYFPLLVGPRRLWNAWKWKEDLLFCFAYEFSSSFCPSQRSKLVVTFFPSFVLSAHSNWNEEYRQIVNRGRAPSLYSSVRMLVHGDGFVCVSKVMILECTVVGGCTVKNRERTGENMQIRERRDWPKNVCGKFFFFARSVVFIETLLDDGYCYM